MICRQRPGTAKGFCFITIEDETGLANAIIRPVLFERDRLIINLEPALVITGRLCRTRQGRADPSLWRRKSPPCRRSGCLSRRVTTFIRSFPCATSARTKKNATMANKKIITAEEFDALHDAGGDMTTLISI